MSLTASVAFSWLREAITTVASAPARARAVSRPSPPLAPVTTAVRPLRSGMSAAPQLIEHQSNLTGNGRASPRPRRASRSLSGDRADAGAPRDPRRAGRGRGRAGLSRFAGAKRPNWNPPWPATDGQPGAAAGLPALLAPARRSSADGGDGSQHRGGAPDGAGDA